MSAKNAKINVDWNDHANNFSIAFGDLLEQQELVDVTLAGDGYLFNAHRLVLAALSPYFRQIFSQMPANQQAFVFMKDVPKQMLQQLITFIYRGEVDVTRANLEDFLSTAKTLKIKGLTDECLSHAFDLQTSTPSYYSTPAHNGYQYQSSHTVRCQRPANENINSDSAQFNHYEQYPADAAQQQTDFQYDGANMTDHEAENSHIEEDSFNHGIVNIDTFMNQEFDKQNDDYGNAFGETVAKTGAPKAKRIKRVNDIADYNIVADIRPNEFGRQNLHYNGYKLYRHTNGASTKTWLCTKRTTDKCRASISTVEVDGVVMMKVFHADHTHEP